MINYDDCEEGFIEVSSSDFGDKTLKNLPRNVSLNLFESDWPEIIISRSGKKISVEFTEHIYNKYFWHHKYNARYYCEAMIRAVKRLIDEGVTLSKPSLESDDDIHLFARWIFKVDASFSGREIIEKARDIYNLVLDRTNHVLEDSDSVLILGKDTGASMAKLKLIQKSLEGKGFNCYIIKEEPDRIGETIIQKVLRYALASKFIIIENSDPSGHLYEFPHLKMAESIVIVLQQKGQGATWMFEDAYHHHNNWKKIQYTNEKLDTALKSAIKWAGSYQDTFKKRQKKVLPWMRK